MTSEKHTEDDFVGFFREGDIRETVPEISGPEAMHEDYTAGAESVSTSFSEAEEMLPAEPGAESFSEKHRFAERLKSRGTELYVKAVRTVFGGDRAIWAIITVLLVISVLVAWSATAYYNSLSTTSQLVRQLRFVGAGFAGLLCIQFVRYQFYGRFITFFYIVALLLTVLTLIMGLEGAEARRDLVIGGFNFQPFEFLKIMVVLMLARQLARRQKNIDRTPILPSFDPRRWKREAQKQMDILTGQTVPLLLPVALACGATLPMSNSTTLIIAATCFTMLCIGRVRKTDLLKLCLLGVVAGAVVFLAGAGRTDIGGRRVSGLKWNIFEKHATVRADGKEYYENPGESYQAEAARMSIASGGLLGKGPGMSTHRRTLSKSESDYAYAFFIEEYGLVGGGIVLLMFMWLMFRAISVFKKCGTAFPGLIVLGLAMMIVLQASIHMAVSVGLFPVTGQQLPIISRGGSSLIFTLLAVGMIIGVSRQTECRTLDEPRDESMLETPGNRQ